MATVQHKKYTVTIIGTGLIGGSIAYALKKNKLSKKIIGVEKSKSFAKKALELGIVQEILPLKKAITQSDIIVLAIPVQEVEKILPTILNEVSHQVVFDVGSTKKSIVERIAMHPKRKNFVATHPMWGTEFSGPTAAQKDAFKGKAVVLCDTDETDETMLRLVEFIYTKLGMHILYMTAEEHDLHTAYISHISHITSFALANTVLKKEKQEKAIFELASGGFESTVRLAKSSAAMWVPIFLQNKKNILDVLMELEVQITEFKKRIIENNGAELELLILNANTIKRILK
jgi:prephenate dehydrogenase